MSEPKDQSTVPSVDSIVRRSFYDVTFEQAMFEWHQQRSKQLLGDPNHKEFQVRYDEHERMFGAMLTAKFCMLPVERQNQVAEAIARSFSEDAFDD